MNDRYQELRGILEDLLNNLPERFEHPAVVIANNYIATHCESCGRVLLGEVRNTKSKLCVSCTPPISIKPPFSKLGRDQKKVMRKVRERRTEGVVTPGAGYPAAFSRWPTDMHDDLLRGWPDPAVQQLIADMAELKITLPVGYNAGSSETRDQFLARPGVVKALADAVYEGVPVRYLAYLIFASVPGQASDKISRAVTDLGGQMRNKHGRRLIK